MISNLERKYFLCNLHFVRSSYQTLRVLGRYERKLLVSCFINDFRITLSLNHATVYIFLESKFFKLSDDM